jgi:hypothetical protein
LFDLKPKPAGTKSVVEDIVFVAVHLSVSKRDERTIIEFGVSTLDPRKLDLY